MIAHTKSADCCEIAQTEAVEDCLRTIFKLAGRNSVVTTSVLAEQLRVTPPTVSVMLKRLEASGLVTRSSNRHVRLTAHGERHATEVTRRHRLVETFLVEVLGLDWDEVHEEADVLEHALSDRLEARIDALLGHPTHDPHGDPIPSRTGEHSETWATPLADAAVGRRFRVDRVADDDSEVLRYLADRGIRPGAVLEVVRREPFGGPLWVRVGKQRHALGPLLTETVHGERI
ncbi:metal-dependent transcriptional regulator [Kribbella sp. CA-294648]|uniref:metal-dependent transcriptional regulator n=1 Tax=Kribbella sp. CA-294648 TaxID=3239948 RepID=UPI003D8B7F26